VLRAFIALTGAKPLGERLSGLGELDLADPLGSLGVVIDYVSGRIQREVRPEQVTRAHAELSRQADAVGDQVKRLRDVTEGLLRRHGKGIVERQFQQKRLSDAISDIFAQIALLSRVTSILEDQGAEVSGQEIYIADTFCTRAAGRVQRSFDQIEDNDDERMVAIAKLALRRGEYGYALFED
jgi:acyl-CoA dehydrogenase family member 9